tara:strand:+ start:195 stop:473 length:279 start_codon:yes stop_codon:yes gene_type:complete
MTAIRPIVKHAFKVDELVEQFVNIDVSDKTLLTGTPEEVNEKFDDAYLVGEARNRLLLIEDQLRNIDEDHVEDWKIFSRDERQLKRFISKWS